MKKLLAIIMSVTLLIPFLNVYAQQATIDTQVVLSTESELIELSEFEGTYFYFNDVEEYTLAITQYPSGLVEIAKFNKASKVLEYMDFLEKDLEEHINSSFSNRTYTNHIDVFTELAENVNNNNIILEDISNTVITIENEATGAQTYSVASKIDTELSSIFGSQYYNKYLQSLNSRDYYATLAETMTFERYKSTSWFLVIGTSVSVVAAMMGIPGSTVMAICFVVFDTATGIYTIKSEVTTAKYVSNVHYTKEAKVRTIYPYRASKTIRGHCLVGDRSASYVRGRESADYDFNSNYDILYRAITNYINSYG